MAHDINNVTERKKMEKRILFQARLVDIISEAIISTDITFNIISWNKAAESIYGWKAEEVMGKNLRDTITVEYPNDDEDSIIKKFIEDGSWKGEVIQPHKNGKKLNILSAVSIIKDESENPIGAVAVNRDITEKKKTEQKLEESERKFRSLVETMSDWIWEVDQNIVYTYSSPKISDLLGYEPEEIIGKTPFDLMPSDEAKRVKEIFRNIVTSQKPFEGLENKNLHKNGRIITLETSGTPIFNIEGSFQGYRGIDRDITERNKAEEKLKEHLTKLEILNRIMIACNKAENLSLLLENTLSLTLELMDFDGGGLYLLEENTREAELACHMGLPTDFIERIKKVNVEESPRDIVFIKGQPIFTENYPEIDPENSIKWGILSAAIIPLFIKNKVIGAINIASNTRYFFSHIEKEILHSIGRDVGILISRMVAEEKLKESEEKYRKISERYEMLLESITDAVFVINNDWIYTLVNKLAEKVVNMPVEKLLGHKITDIFPGIESTSFFKTYETVMNTRKPQRVKDSFMLPEGTKGYYEVSVYPISEGILCIGRNITEEVEAEQLLKESEEKYREAYNLVNFYKDLFAHDMSNILQSIISTADFYSMFQNNPEKMKEMGNIAEGIKIHAKRGANLISNVRKLSKLDETETRLSAIEIFDILGKSVENTINSFQERNVKIDVEGISKDMKVLGNELLTDIFDNILNNAVKYNYNEDIVKIDVKISKTREEDREYIRFEFIDYGMGVPNNKKDTLFKKKYDTNIGNRGMGMGLSLVKKIVEKYNGKIWVENRVKEDYSKGSNFIILLREA